MDMPKPGEPHRKLRRLAGSWIGEERMHPSPWDPKGGPAKARIEARLSSGGFFVVSDYQQERGGRVTYQGHGVYGWDAKAGAFTMWWFDSIGSAPAEPARGRWEGDRLVFQDRSPTGHVRYSYTFQDEKRYAFTIEHSTDGTTWTSFMDGDYTKR